MPKRGENIHKRKDGRWEGRYRQLCAGKAEECDRYISVYGRTYGEVKSKLAKLITEQSTEYEREEFDASMAPSGVDYASYGDYRDYAEYPEYPVKQRLPVSSARSAAPLHAKGSMRCGSSASRKKRGTLDSKAFYNEKQQSAKNIEGTYAFYGGQACGGGMLLSDVLSMWINGKKLCLKGATEYKYRYMITNHILPELGLVPVESITSAVICDFIERKLKNGRLDGKGGLAPSYVKTLILILQSAISFAAKEDMCPPLRSPISKPTSDKKELTILTLEDQLKFESFLMKDLDRTRLGILISLHTGMRIGEICALTWEDVDISSRIIHIRHTVSRICRDLNKEKAATQLVLDAPKTKSSVRDIPISSRLLPILLSVREDDSFYVVSNGNTFLSPRTLEYRYHKLLDECGIEKVNFHALRHTFATRCIEAGVDVKSLSEILGHANVGITLNTYVHSSMDMKRKQIEKLSMHMT